MSSANRQRCVRVHWIFRGLGNALVTCEGRDEAARSMEELPDSVKGDRKA